MYMWEYTQADRASDRQKGSCDSSHHTIATILKAKQPVSFSLTGTKYGPETVSKPAAPAFWGEREKRCEEVGGLHLYTTDMTTSWLFSQLLLPILILERGII